MANDVDQRYQVRSVSRAVEILECLASAGDGLTVTEVARRVGASKSAAFATLQTLEGHGVAASQGEGTSRRYRLGLALARLGETAISQVSLRDIAMPVLRELTESTGMTARVAVPENGSAVVVGRVNAPGAVRFDLHMGRREPPHCTGVGKAMLAELTDDAAKELAEHSGMPARTARTITDVGRLLDNLAEVRRHGYALDDEEDAAGVFCVGSAVRDHRGACAGAISVTGLKLDLSPAHLHKIGETVREHAARITAILTGDA